MGTTWDAIREIIERSHADADSEAFFGWLIDRVREGTRQPDFRSYLQLYREHLPAACVEFGVPGLPEDAELIFVHARRRRPYPEVAGALESLKRRFKIGVISNADTKPLRGNLEDAGLSFDTVVTSESAQAYKPDPRIFEQALAKLSLTPEQVAHVGDSPEEDIAPAKALGMTAVWIKRDGDEYPAGIATPDYTITSLDQLIGLWD